MRPLALSGGGGGGGGNVTRIKTTLIGNKRISVGDRLKGWVKDLKTFGIFVDIGVGKDALMKNPSRRIRQIISERMQKKQRVFMEVRVSGLKKVPKKGLLVDLKFVAFSKDARSHTGMPRPKVGIFVEQPAYVGWRVSGDVASRIIRIRGESYGRLLDRLSVAPIHQKLAGDTISVIKTNVRIAHGDEIYCSADFMPVAEALLRAISAEKIFRAASLGDISSVGVGREVPNGYRAGLIIAADPILEGIDYFPEGVIFGPDYQLARTEAMVHSGDCGFKLITDGFKPDWKAAKIIHAMAGGHLQAIPVPIAPKILS